MIDVFDDQSLLYFIHSKRNAIKTIFYHSIVQFLSICSICSVSLKPVLQPWMIIKKTVRALLSNAKINITLHALEGALLVFEWTVLLSNSSIHPHKFLLLLQANSTPVIVAITTTNNMLAYTIHSFWVLIRASPPFVTVLMGCGKISN